MLLARFLQAVIRTGDLHVTDADGSSWRFGDGQPPHASIRLHDRKLHRSLALNPNLRFGEAYVDGTLTIEEGSLYDLLDIATRNVTYVERQPIQDFGRRVSRAMRFLQQYNPVGRAQENVAHHYDLSGELYDLFLDSDRQYSCAYFASEDDDLETAQENKKRHLAAKLMLDRPGLKILDIGSGWGGLGMYLSQFGADVTGVTLSTEQHKVSTERAARAGLSGRVRFQLKDYRHETQKYDRIVSVGMFEHVGATHYVEFFRKVSDLLTDDGVMVLHSIGRMEPPGTTTAWLRKYIFPGGYTPALSEVLTAVEKVGLWVTDIEILRQHYAKTLHAWAERFQQRRADAVKLYDERFCRMWEFYLIGCEATFRNNCQTVFQMQLSKRQNTVPMTRDYIFDWERDRLAYTRQAAE